MPMCSIVTDQDIEEVCETIVPDKPPQIPPLDPLTCFKRVCEEKNTTRLDFGFFETLLNFGIFWNNLEL